MGVKSKKTTGQSAAAKKALKNAKTGETVRIPGAGALRKGGTNKGGPGRPTNDFRAKMAALLEKQKTSGKDKGRPLWEPYFIECLEGKHGPSAFKSAMDMAADRAHGKVPNVSKIVGSTDDDPVKIIVEHQTIHRGE